MADRHFLIHKDIDAGYTRTHIDILDETDADFIKNGVTLFDCADIYVDTDSNTIDQELMSYQPEQLLRGYSATINAAIKA